MHPIIMPLIRNTSFISCNVGPQGSAEDKLPCELCDHFVPVGSFQQHIEQHGFPMTKVGAAPLSYPKRSHMLY